MNINVVYDKIVENNKSQLEQELKKATINTVITKHFTINIKIDFISLCDQFPVEINFLIMNENLLISVEDKLYEKLKMLFQDFDYENVSVLNKLCLCYFNYLINFPINIFNLNLKNIYKYGLSINSDSINKSFMCLIEGTIFKIKEQMKCKSKFYKCDNSACNEKSIMVRLKNMTCLMTESSKSFIYVINDLNTKCTNCKSILVEIISYRTLRKVYYYVISNQNYAIYAKSNLDLKDETCFLGTVKRRSNGKLIFHISSAYEKKVMKVKYIATNEHYAFNNLAKLTNFLLEQAKFYYRHLKQNVDIHDTLVLIMLNIFSKNESRILILTSDEFYVARCAHHFFEVIGTKTRIFYNIKTFENKKGLCIRSYEIVNYKNIDFMFHIPIDHALDYSYESPNKFIQIDINNKSLDEMDHANIQNMFVIFRKKYKRIIEPERLLNTLTGLYESILNLSGTSDYINEFILTYFMDKLI